MTHFVIQSILLPTERLLASAALTIAGGCLALAVGASFWQVVSRFVLQDPAIWSEALTRLALIWMTMLGFSVAIRRGALVAIDLMVTKAQGWFYTLIRTIITLSIVCFCCILGWFGTLMALRVVAQEMAGLEISVFWGYVSIPAGCSLACISAIANWFQSLQEETSGIDSEVSV